MKLLIFIFLAYDGEDCIYYAGSAILNHQVADDFRFTLGVLRVDVAVPHLRGKGYSFKTQTIALIIDKVRNAFAKIHYLTS